MLTERKGQKKKIETEILGVKRNAFKNSYG